MNQIEEQIENSLSAQHLTEDIKINLIDEELLVQQQSPQKRSDEWEVINPQHHNVDITLIKEKELKSNVQFALDRFTKLLNTGQDLAKKFADQEQLINRCIQLTKLSMIGSMQIQQVLNIMNEQPNISKKINEEYDIRGSKETINDYQFNIVLNYLNENVLFQLLEISQNLFKEVTKSIYRNFCIYLSKLQSCLEQMPNALEVSKTDLFNYQRDQQPWTEFQDCIIEKKLGTKQEVEASYDKLAEGLLLGNAMISKGSEYKGEFTKQFMQGFGAIYYLFAKKNAKERAKHFLAEPDKGLAFKVWNLGEEGVLKTLMPLLFENIWYNQKLYIPRLFPWITKDSIQKQYLEGTINKINGNIGQFAPYDNLPTQENLYKKDPQKVVVRFLCHISPQEKQNQNLMNQAIKFKQGNHQFEQIIIHIHGGGFVSMSSRSHQTYSRKWANRLQVPIFSIDYRMAPESPYPAGLDDIWQAYMFIVTFIEKYFNITPKRIALVGDSAGGNLVAALTIQTIKSRVRQPDGILMAYPALSLNVKEFTPSFLVSLDDNLLHHTVLKLCLESYISEPFNGKIDPLLSPSKVSDEILSRFPKTRIIVGTYDPLHDESFRLVQRMKKLNKDVKVIEYQWMPHGFLSFDVINGMPQAKQTVQDATDILKELIQQ